MRQCSVFGLSNDGLINSLKKEYYGKWQHVANTFNQRNTPKRVQLYFQE